MRLRRLNKSGEDGMAAFLDSLKTDTPEPYPEHILTDPQTSEVFEPAVEVERRRFPRRFELAQYLYERFRLAGLEDFPWDSGLWAWLALFWFEELCTQKGGRRDPGERARWLPELDSSRRSYRHLVLGPYLAYYQNAKDPEQALCLLYNPPQNPGELVGQLAAVPAFVQCPTVLSAATRLYLDEKGRLKTGSCGKGPGTVRRLRAVLGQYDRTFDLHTLGPDELIAMLPREFARFRPETVR